MFLRWTSAADNGDKPEFFRVEGVSDNEGATSLSLVLKVELAVPGLDELPFSILGVPIREIRLLYLLTVYLRPDPEV